MFHLNTQQNIVVDEAVKWFKYSSSTLFQFDGLAGTGKSVVLNEILNRLKLEDHEVLPMAYTGQACTIMRKKGLPLSCTCHSGLFMAVEEIAKDKNGKAIINKKFNTPIVKWKFVPKDFHNSRIKLFIIDEAWMVPKRFKSFIDSTGIKVIATGDSGQLPPVGDDPGYLVDGNIYHLTELMRQASNSPIVYLANRARNGLPIDCGKYGNDVFVIFDDELDKNIMLISDIVFCAKNSTRENINNIIRTDILHYNTPYPQFGERVICRKNNWGLEVNGIPLVNGLTGCVISPPDIGRFDGETIRIDFLPDLLNEPFKDIYINYNYLKATNSERESLKINPYLIGERFEYAYASTVHLSQGSEYDCGIYFEEPFRQDMTNALNYTAITRFKNKLIYVKKRPKYWYMYKG